MTACEPCGWTFGERGEIVWNPVFLDFARYWLFTELLNHVTHKGLNASTNSTVFNGCFRMHVSDASADSTAHVSA